VPLSASPSVDNIIIGGPTQISISAYVASRGAGTFTDLGHSVGGAEFEQKRDRYKPNLDAYLGSPVSEPIKAEGMLTFALAEPLLKSLAYCLGMDPAVEVTGTTPNFVLKSNYSKRGIYQQVKVVGRGHGTNSIRTFIGWRSVPLTIEKWIWKKDAELLYKVTFEVCEEPDTPASGAWQMTDS